MDAALGAHGRGLEEEVHQHGLAAPDAAVDVDPGEPLVRLRRLAPEAEPAERHLLAGARVVVPEPHGEKLQLLHGRALRRVGVDLARGDELAVTGQRPVAHVRPLRLAGTGQGGP